MTATVDHRAIAIEAPCVTPAEMRRVLGHFCTGVTIVAGMHGDEPVGLACQSFTSVSLEPPLVLICVAHTSTSWPRIRQAGRFCVNVLAADQQHVSAGFGRSGGDKFAGLPWHPTPWGPAIDGVLATVGCDITEARPAGDHDLVIGHVRELVTHRDSEPLLFFRGQYGLDA